MQTHQDEPESERTGAEHTASVSHLVLHGDRIPRHVDAFDWPKRGEGLPDGVLPQLIVDGANVHSTHDGQSPLTLSRHLMPADRKSVRQLGTDSKRDTKTEGRTTSHLADFIHQEVSLLTDWRGDSVSPRPIDKDAIWGTETRSTHGSDTPGEHQSHLWTGEGCYL